MLPNDATATVATMSNVAAGTYVVSAKTTLAQTTTTGSAGTGSLVRCAVNGDPAPGANSPTDDYSETHVWRGVNQEVGTQTLNTQVTVTLAGTGSFALRCWRSDSANQDLIARESKITAIKVDSAVRQAVGG